VALLKAQHSVDSQSRTAVTIGGWMRNCSPGTSAFWNCLFTYWINADRRRHYAVIKASNTFRELIVPCMLFVSPPSRGKGKGV